MRHFFPEFPKWLDDLPDHRDPIRIVYHKRFLACWGISLFLFQLGSRRQLDFDLRDPELQVLPNLNRLAGTSQETCPVHNTLNYLLAHPEFPYALSQLRRKMMHRLIRMKYLQEFRLLGHYVFAVDGSGWLYYRERHCAYCLSQKHGDTTIYLHQALEAKLLGAEGIALSMGTAFIENADAPTAPCAAADFKQDCELKAFSRLAVDLHTDFPQLKLCVTGDALYACGRTLAICQQYDWAYVLTFKEGSLPAVWRDVQELLKLCPENRLEHWAGDVRQVYRWVLDVSYTDDQQRTWRFNALFCEETKNGETTNFAWITNLPLTPTTVVEVAEKGGRARWNIENAGFNRQKNSGLQLEHAFSQDPNKQKAYYYLLQIAHIILILLEKGKWLRQVAAATGKTVLQLFGSLKNIARRLLESIRYCLWEDDPLTEAAEPLTVDTS